MNKILDCHDSFEYNTYDEEIKALKMTKTIDL